MGLNSAVTYVAVFSGTGGFGLLYGALGFVATALAAAAATLLAAVVARSWPRLERRHAEQVLEEEHHDQRGDEHAANTARGRPPLPCPARRW